MNSAFSCAPTVDPARPWQAHVARIRGIRRETADVDIDRRSAARAKLPCSTTRTNAVMAARRSMIIAHQETYIPISQRLSRTPH